MERFKLSDMIGGWFVGNFAPHVLHSEAFEVAVKYYVAGHKEPVHYHKISREITLIAHGKVRVNDLVLASGDIVLINPNETCEFEALEDTTTVVVKTPSSKDDKYLV